MKSPKESSEADGLNKQPARLGARDRILVGQKVYIRKRGKRGQYVAEFWHEGENRRRSLKTADRTIATRKALQLDADLLAGSYAVPKAAIPLAPTVKEFLEVKDGEGRAAKTITKYREWLDSFVAFAEQAGVTTLGQITAGLFERFRTFRKPSQSPKSLYTGLTIIKSFIKWCAAPGRDYLARNPVASCKVPEPYVHPKFTPSRKQVSAILTKASGARRAQYAVLAYTGLRAGEMQMLRPQDVDLKRGWIHVVGRPGWVPKTRQARKVPIHPLLMTYLDAYVASLPKAAKSRPYFFCAPASKKYPTGDHPIDLRKLNVRFQRLARSLGIKTGRKADGIVIHSLRHFFETRAVNSGVPQLVVDAWMGHAGDGSMSRIYYGKSDATSRRFMKRVRFVKQAKPKAASTSTPSQASTQGSNP